MCLQSGTDIISVPDCKYMLSHGQLHKKSHSAKVHKNFQAKVCHAKFFCFFWQQTVVFCQVNITSFISDADLIER